MPAKKKAETRRDSSLANNVLLEELLERDDAEISNRDLALFILSLSKKLDNLTNEVVQCKKAMDVMSKEMLDVKKEVDKLRFDANEREQWVRGGSVRVFNYKVPDQCEKSVPKLLTHLYDNLFHPCLMEAVKAGEISENVVPGALQLLEYGHQLPRRVQSVPVGGDQPPPPTIIVRFASRTFRSLIMRYKKTVLANYNVSVNPRSRFHKVFITDDLTKINSRALKELSSKSSVERAFSYNGKIKYTLKADPSRVKILSNPFDLSDFDFSGV